MTVSISEKNWKPVNMNAFSTASALQEATNGGFGISNDVSRHYNWYQRLISNQGKRRTKLHRYDQMDNTTDIARALDVIAEDVSSMNADEERPFILEFDDSGKINKTTMNTLQRMRERWEKRTALGRYFYDYVREALKYGACFLQIQPDASLKYLVPERLHGYILDANDDSVVSHYLYNDKSSYMNKEGDDVGSLSAGNRQDYAKIPIEELVILKVGDGPFGQSVLDRVFTVWRKLQLLEDAIVIYRVVRAPERRVFYIDIGNMPVQRAESYVERLKIKMRQKQVSQDDSLNTDYNPQSMQEDYFIPQTGDGRGSKIDTMQGGQNLGELSDLQYFNKKLALGLRIPPGYMDTYSQDTQPQQYNDGRVGSLYVSEMRYLGFVRRVQVKLAHELFHNFKAYCKKNDVVIPSEDVSFDISPPQSFALYKEAEKNQMLLNVQNSSDNVRGLSKRFSMKKFLQLSEEELTENEYMQLEEQGLSQDEIKSLTKEQRYNLVYGDGSKAKKELSSSGIDLGDGGGQGGGGGRFGSF